MRRLCIYVSYVLQLNLDTRNLDVTKPPKKRPVLEASETVVSKRANLDVTRPSGEQTNCVSLSTPKAFGVPKFLLFTLLPPGCTGVSRDALGGKEVNTGLARAHLSSLLP